MQEKDNTIKNHWDRLLAALSEKEEKNPVIIAIAVLTIITLTAGEPIRVLCRKNQGKEEISYIRLGLSLLAFLLCGVTIIMGKETFAAFTFYNTFAATNLTMLITGIFYIGFGITVFVAGMVAKAHAEKSAFLIEAPEYPGDSLLFTDKNLARVRNFYEPLTFLVIGLVLGLLHPVIGFPLIICALSYWVCLIVELSLNIEQKRRISIMRRNDILKGPLMRIVRPHAARKRLFLIRISWFKS